MDALQCGTGVHDIKRFQALHCWRNHQSHPGRTVWVFYLDTLLLSKILAFLRISSSFDELDGLAFVAFIITVQVCKQSLDWAMHVHLSLYLSTRDGSGSVVRVKMTMQTSLFCSGLACPWPRQSHLTSKMAERAICTPFTSNALKCKLERIKSDQPEE